MFLQEVLPSGLHGFVSMYKHLSLTVFYVFAELWSTVILSVLFWGFANEITSLHEARRFYSVLSMQPT